jgi:hypothetical protein
MNSPRILLFYRTTGTTDKRPQRDTAVHGEARRARRAARSAAAE